MITYCTNIHPGEKWNDTFADLRTHLLQVKEAVSPSELFPIGLRLSNQASIEIDEKTSENFREWCFINNCFVPTINAFPYGSFHGASIKENVYFPDWRDMKRVEYTNRAAGLINSWLPENMTGSISTVPVGFKAHVSKDDFGLIKSNLNAVLEHLDRLKQKSGKDIILSLEPEPGCILETAADAVRFFEEMNFADDLRDSIGICFDCCHHAVEFEDPAEALSMISDANIRIGKIQVSSALSLQNPDHTILKSFNEDRYLHQVVIKHGDNTLNRYNDIPDALENHVASDGEEWRIHFHVPVFVEKMHNYGTTQEFTEEIISLAEPGILLEVETYTWNVLPSELQMESVTDSIIREIQWVQSKVNE